MEESQLVKNRNLSRLSAKLSRQNWSSEPVTPSGSFLTLRFISVFTTIHLSLSLLYYCLLSFALFLPTILRGEGNVTSMQISAG
jgi:hypothetical protein